MRRNARLTGDEPFHTAARCISHVPHILHVHIGHRAGLSANVRHLHFAQFKSQRRQHDIQRNRIYGVIQHSLSCFIANHREYNNHGIGAFAREPKFSLQITHCTASSAFYTHLNQFQRLALVIHNFSFNDNRLSETQQKATDKQQHHQR